ncbi:MAG: OmpA family protein [Thermodesulfobacteriota bacterium]|nr:OmpA family protein [Thermodesulfobacteriota bacterium]
MTLVARTILLTMLFFLYTNNMAIAGTPSYSGADDVKAVMAADKAVEQLGKNSGAILINFKSINIIGLAATVAGQVVDVEKTLKDLNAKKVGTEIQISLSGDVLFDFDKCDIKAEAEEDLAKIVKVVTELKKNHMLIEGHTDSKGSESYNQKLSLQRANSVKTWFIKKGGLNQVEFATKGYGEAKPKESNTKPDGSDNPEGRAKNRRVEFRIK